MINKSLRIVIYNMQVVEVVKEFKNRCIGIASSLRRIPTQRYTRIYRTILRRLLDRFLYFYRVFQRGALSLFREGKKNFGQVKMWSLRIYDSTKTKIGKKRERERNQKKRRKRATREITDKDVEKRQLNNVSYGKRYKYE